MSKESSKKRVILFVVLVIVVLACGLYYWNAYLSKTKIDLSKNMTVHYIGISGLASIDYVDYHFDEETTNRYQKFLQSVSYQANKSSHLSNGESITITSDYNHEIAKQLNLRIVNTQRTFKVSGLPYRYKKGTEIDKSLLTELKNQAFAKLSANDHNDREADSFSYYGTYFLKHQDFDSFVLIYKADHHKDDEMEHSSKYYYYQVVGIDSTFYKEKIGKGKYVVSLDDLEYEGHDVTNETVIPLALTHLENYYASEVTKID